jgi:predicted porin
MRLMRQARTTPTTASATRWRSAASAATVRSSSAWATKQLGASVGAKFGAFGVGAEYAQNEVAGNKRKAVFLSGSMAVGQGTVYLTLTRDDQGTDLDDDGLGLTYSHGLSKRTYVYASLGYNRIEQPSGDDLKARAVALGARHYFSRAAAAANKTRRGDPRRFD